MIEPSISGRSKVLVTGASGFIGSAIARAFASAGYAVRVLVRQTSTRTNLRDDFELFEGDIRDRSAVARALAGMRYLVHAAADYRLWVPARDSLIHNNVEGTRILMEEALRAGVQRIVYTSSVSTIALARDGTPADERGFLRADQVVGAYKHSKVLAEQVVLQMIERDRLPAVIVNPSAPIGPRDVKPTPTGRVIIEAASGRMPGFIDTGLNLVHVDDVAAGHLAALHHGQIGERYILGGENVSLATMLSEIARAVGRPRPRLRLPRSVVFPVAIGAETWARLTGCTPFVTREALAMARHHMFFSSAKAERELGYTARPYQEALVDAIAWFRESGRLRVKGDTPAYRRARSFAE